MNRNNLVLLLCCLIPIAAIAAFLFFGLSWRYALFAIVMVCPLIHLLATDSAACCQSEEEKKEAKKEVS